MTEITLFGFGIGVTFFFLAGCYVYLRETSFVTNSRLSPVPIRERHPRRRP